MRAEMRDEYDSLVKIEAAFANLAETEGFATIHPLVLYEDLGVMVMEEADIRPIRDYFQARAMWWDNTARQTFASYLERTGRWLRIFHDQISDVKTDGPNFPDSWYQSTKERIARLSAHGANRTLAAVQTFLDQQYIARKDARIPYRTMHYNLSAVNVFITSDGKICSFDPHNTPGPVFYDLAKFITDLEMSRTQILTLGHGVPPAWQFKFQHALLKGYFKDEPFDEAALDLFRMLSLIERWDDSEARSRRAKGSKRLFYLFGLPPTRLFFASRLRQCMAEFSRKYNS